MCKECNEFENEVKENKDELEIKKIIEYVVKENPQILFKKCTECGRYLPVHDIFFPKHPTGKYGYNSKCKKCVSEKKYHNVYTFKINDDLTEFEIIQIYKDILNNKLKSFPRKFFNNDINISVVVRYLIKNILKLDTREKICESFKGECLDNYKLKTLRAGTTNTRKGLEDLLNLAFPEYNIKLWELVATDVGSNYWTETNINDACNFLYNSLIKEGIKSIYEAECLGFETILTKYKLQNLRYIFNNNITKLFESIYNTKFDKTKKIYKEIELPNIELPLDRKNEGIIYSINSDYHNLDKKGKILINTIILFIENHNRYPKDFELKNSDGYLSIKYYHEYFNSKSLAKVFNQYVSPIPKEKPKTMICSKCGREKEFNNENFGKDNHYEWNLRTVCRECLNKDQSKREYKKKGIIFNEFEDITPIEWYEHKCRLIGHLNLPDFCYTMENIIIIMRYVAFNKMNLKTKEDILKNFNTKSMRKYNLLNYYKNFNNLPELIRLCFPEYNIKLYEMMLPNHVYKDYLNIMLKEFIENECKDIISNYIIDIPKYLNQNYMRDLNGTMYWHIARKTVYNSYYDWACSVYPEYKKYWTKEDFGHIISYDGVEFDSYQEKNLYEYIKKQEIFKYIESIGRDKYGRYIFKLDDTYEYEKFCPDFVIEYVWVKDKKIKLEKPIIIEYYGMYDENSKHHVFQNYIKKTRIKENFYKSRKDIYYIGIFPNDIKNNYEELTKKLALFFVSNFNIDIQP